MSGQASSRRVEIFEASCSRVFDAWTQEEQLKRWWGPGAYDTVHVSVDLRVGGRYEIVLEPGPLRLVGEYREITPPTRLVYTFRWASGVPDPRESLVTIELRDLGGRTELTLIHDNFAGPDRSRCTTTVGATVY